MKKRVNGFNLSLPRPVYLRTVGSASRPGYDNLEDLFKDEEASVGIGT